MREGHVKTKLETELREVEETKMGSPQEPLMSACIALCAGILWRCEQTGHCTLCLQQFVIAAAGD